MWSLGALVMFLTFFGTVSNKNGHHHILMKINKPKAVHR